MKMKKRMISFLVAALMLAASFALTACGGADEAESNPADSQAQTEETVQAADPLTDEEAEADDSDGCIEDSEDLLY